MAINGGIYRYTAFEKHTAAFIVLNVLSHLFVKHVWSAAVCRVSVIFCRLSWQSAATTTTIRLTANITSIQLGFG